MLYSHKLLVFAPSCPSAGVCVCVYQRLRSWPWLCGGDCATSTSLLSCQINCHRMKRFQDFYKNRFGLSCQSFTPQPSLLLIWFHAGAYITKIKQGNADLTYFITTNLSVSAKPNSASCSSTISRSLFLTKQFWLNCRLKELQVPKNCHPREHDVRRELPWRMGGSGQQEPCLQLLLSASID